MNDFQIMLDMFKRAKERGVVDYLVCGESDGSKKYIYLFKHKFVFNLDGVLIESHATPLNDITS